MDFETLQHYIEPQLMIIIPMLWGIGMAVKKSSIHNKYIPLILMTSSCVVSMLHLMSNRIILTSQDISSCLFAAITQGCVIWLVAWVSYEKVLKDKELGI